MSDYYLNEDQRLADLRRFYVLGRFQDEKNSGYSTVAIENAAHDDFDGHVDALRETFEDEGYGRGHDEATELLMSDLKTMEQRVAEVTQKLEQRDSGVYGEIYFLLGKLAKLDPVDTNDVEKWAEQDGWNGALQTVMEKVQEIQKQANDTPVTPTVIQRQI